MFQLRNYKVLDARTKELQGTKRLIVQLRAREYEGLLPPRFPPPIFDDENPTLDVYHQLVSIGMFRAL